MKWVFERPNRKVWRYFSQLFCAICLFSGVAYSEGIRKTPRLMEDVIFGANQETSITTEVLTPSSRHIGIYFFGYDSLYFPKVIGWAAPIFSHFFSTGVPILDYAIAGGGVVYGGLSLFYEKVLKNQRRIFLKLGNFNEGYFLSIDPILRRKFDEFMMGYPQKIVGQLEAVILKPKRLKISTIDELPDHPKDTRKRPVEISSVQVIGQIADTDRVVEVALENLETDSNYCLPMLRRLNSRLGNVLPIP